MAIIKTLIYDKESDLSNDPSGQAVKNIVSGCMEAFAQFRDNPGEGVHIGEVLVGALVW